MAADPGSCCPLAGGWHEPCCRARRSPGGQPVSRRLPLLLLFLLTAFAAGSAWGANALLAKFVAAPGPIPESEARRPR